MKQNKKMKNDKDRISNKKYKQTWEIKKKWSRNVK